MTWIGPQGRARRSSPPRVFGAQRPIPKVFDPKQRLMAAAHVYQRVDRPVSGDTVHARRTAV